MEESMKAQENKRVSRPLLIAMAALGLLLYTAGVCTCAVVIDRRGRRTDEGQPLGADAYDMAMPATAGGGALEPGERIIAAGECEFTVTDCAFGREVYASGAGADAGGYKAGSDNEGYVDLSVRYKNLGRTPADIDGIANPGLQCAGGDEYGAFAVIESADGSRFLEAAQVPSRGSGRLHYLFRVPKAVGEGAFRIRFTIAEEEYTIDFAAGFEGP